MSDYSILNSIIDEYQCPICFGLLEDPQSPCRWGHKFCSRVSKSRVSSAGMCSNFMSNQSTLNDHTILQCLREYTTRNIMDNQILLCPVCRASFNPSIVIRPLVADQEGNIRVCRFERIIVAKDEVLMRYANIDE
jgi:hypothetical protein